MSLRRGDSACAAAFEARAVCAATMQGLQTPSCESEDRVAVGIERSTLNSVMKWARFRSLSATRVCKYHRPNPGRSDGFATTALWQFWTKCSAQTQGSIARNRFLRNSPNASGRAKSTQGLDNRLIEPLASRPPVKCRERLGGTLRFYASTIGRQRDFVCFRTIRGWLFRTRTFGSQP
jgi:hypothetical protein